MNGLPDFDPTRSAAIREILGDTVVKDFGRRQTTKRITILISLILAAVLLSGGGVAWALTGRFPFVQAPQTAPTSTPIPTPAPTPTSTQPATPSPAPPAPIDPADPSTWIIGAGEVGPVSLGGSMTAAASSITEMTQHTYPSCPIVEYSRAVNDQWSVGITLFPAYGTTDDIGIIEVVGSGEGGQLVTARSPKTPEGIGIGSTFGQLQLAYPGISQTSPAPFAVYSIQQGDGSWIDFQLNQDGIHIDGIFVMNSRTPPSAYCD